MEIFSKRITGQVTLWILLIYSAPGCTKEEFNAGKFDTSLELEPSLATPLGYFDFRLDKDLQLSENSRLTSNSDRLLCLNYYGEIITAPAGSLFRFERISERFQVTHPDGITTDLSSQPFTLNASVRVPFILSNIALNSRIDLVRIVRGSIRFSDIIFPEAYGEAIITIHGLKINNQAFQTTFTPGMTNHTTSVSGYQLELAHDDERQNLLNIDISVYFPQQNITLQGNEILLSVDFSIEVQDWFEIEGYLGEETIRLGQSSFPVELHDFFREGDLYFAEPSLKIVTQNSFSVPLGLSFTQISAFSEEYGSLFISGSGVPSAPEYFMPSYPQQSALPGETMDSLIIFSGNSDIREVISRRPYNISYQIELTTNPGDQNLPNTIHAKSTFSASLELELPFYGSARNVMIMDTLSTDLSSIKMPEDDMIQTAIFKLYYENSIPAEIKLQIYLADHNHMITDTIFETYAEINAAPPSDKYSDEPPSVTGQLEAFFPASKLDRIREARFIIGEAIINTNEEYENVKIFDNQGFNINLGVIFQIKTNIEDL